MKVKSKKIAVRKSEYLEYKHSDKAAEVALYYGFTPLPAPLTVTKEDRENARALGGEEPKEKNADCLPLPSVAEKIPIVRYYFEKRMNEAAQPVFLISDIAAAPAARKSAGEKRMFFDIIGSDKSIAEALLIKTIIALLTEEGYAELSVHINSVGDKESANRFARELASYYRKNITNLPANCRLALRRNPAELLECGHEKCRLLGKDAPQSISFLSEASRAHFKEVLECLEELGITFEMDHQLIGSRALATETVFAVRGAREDAKDSWVASGFRYNTLTKRLGAKREVPAVGGLVRLPRDSARRKTATIRMKKPDFFFLQLGSEAKQKCLAVVETLRRAGIPLYHAIARDKLGSQLGAAEQARTPYAIIMGQKEALENSVIVRDSVTRAQETVPIAELSAYLKNLKKKKERR